MITLFLLLLLPGNAGKHIDLVRNSTLELNPYAPIGLAFGAYSWFEKHKWRQINDKGVDLVIFTGVISDAEAHKDFEEKNRYRFHMALKAIQLAPNYQMDEKKDKLSFIIRFKINGDSSFEIHSGSLGIRHSETGEWRYVPFTEKALLTVVSGLYKRTNPYELLVRGLPFK